MTRSTLISTITIVLSVLLIVFIIRSKPTPTKEIRKYRNALNKIRQEGVLNATTEFSSTNYFIYRGTPMGFQYELLTAFAKSMGVKLNLYVRNDLEKQFECLSSYNCDIVAMDLTITKERKKFMDFTEPYMQTRQVLVQRKPANWEKLSWRQLEDTLIRNQLELGGKAIFVQKNSSFVERLKNLSDEIADTIVINELDFDVEKLIAMVSEGEIEYTIADEHIAMVNNMYYDNIDIRTAVSFSQNLAWGVKKGEDSLRIKINEWLSAFKNTVEYAYLYNKYFKNQRSFNIFQSEFYSINTGKISLYDSLIKHYAQKINWDWRLLASLIYQESRFKPDLTSWAGAKGLMQLMPETAEKFGCSDPFNPEQNIRASVGFIKWLDGYFIDEVPDFAERQKFILAAYNCGFGHITDAQELARKHGRNPAIWFDNAEFFLMQKSNPKYFRDEVVKYGYCRGIETCNFVHQIYDRYQQYIQVIE